MKVDEKVRIQFIKFCIRPRTCIRIVYGIAIAALTIVISELFHTIQMYFGIEASKTLVFFFTVLPIVSVTMGWFVGLPYAIASIMYSIWLLQPNSAGLWIRELVLFLGSFTVAGVCGYYYRKSRLVEKENVLYNHIRIALHNLDDILDEDLQDPETDRMKLYTLLNENVRHHLAHSISYISGFKWLYQQMRYQQSKLEEDTYGDPK